MYPNSAGCYYVTVKEVNATENSFEVFLPQSNKVCTLSPLSISDQASASLAIYAFTSISQLQLAVDTAILSDEGTSVTVTYNYDTDTGEAFGLPRTSFPCLEIMSFAGAGLSKCIFVSDYELVIMLPVSVTTSLPVPGDTIHFLAQRIKPKCVNACPVSVVFANAQVMSLKGPLQAPPPVVSIGGPSHITCCNTNLVLDISGSSGAGGRAWQRKEWFVVRLEDLAVSSDNIASLKSSMEKMLWFDCVHGQRGCNAIPTVDIGLGSILLCPER